MEEEFVAQAGPIGGVRLVIDNTEVDGIEQIFQPLIIEVGCREPGQAGGGSPARRAGRGSFANAAGSGIGVSGLPASPGKS